MSNEKKSAAAEEVKEKACELSMEELEKVSGGKMDKSGILPVIFAQTCLQIQQVHLQGDR